MIIELKANSAFQINEFQIGEKHFIGIARLYKKKGDTEWHMGKNVALPFDDPKDKKLIKDVANALLSYVK